ncbi:hypothetical protein [Bartonella senegalensis]|nr:hypothetical protein [Bartonella senegalensis]
MNRLNARDVVGDKKNDSGWFAPSFYTFHNANSFIANYPKGG